MVLSPRLYEPQITLCRQCSYNGTPTSQSLRYKAMLNFGINISQHCSKNVLGMDFDLVVCDDTAQSCSKIITGVVHSFDYPL